MPGVLSGHSGDHLDQMPLHPLEPRGPAGRQRPLLPPAVGINVLDLKRRRNPPDSRAGPPAPRCPMTRKHCSTDNLDGRDPE